MELQWSFSGKIVACLWIQHRRTDREYNFQGQLIVPMSHHAQIGMAYNFQVHKWSEDELLCTLCSKNNASAGGNVRVVARWVIDNVKHQFLGFDATKSLLLES